MSKVTTLDGLKRFFKFPFEGAEWQKRFFIGAGLILLSFFIPIIPAIFVCGYIVQVMRQAIAGHDLALPAWEDWGKLGLDGLRFCAVGLAFLLPGLLAYFCGTSLYALASLFLPFSMQLAEAGRILYTLIPLFFIGAMMILFITIFLGTVLTLLGTAPLPMAIAHFVKQDEIGAAFRFREWWPFLWRNKVVYLIAWALCGGLMLISYYGIMILYATLILCMLIPVVSAPLLFYCMLVWAATFGEVYRGCDAS
ncbi:MAG TPA: DUF4013 domain-containing protein [Anaerolineae bacterium]|nr:DUF4013 domain-containing protein [Anaerolineae bacterium]HQK14924.1 DUF4013 domain-containing protein [Anaerolineae bacterium]